MERRKDQPVGNHDASVNGDDGVPSIYAAMGVPSLADQAENGGWLPHGQPVHGDNPNLRTIGSAGSYVPVADYDDKD